MGGAKGAENFRCFLPTGTWASSAKFPPDSPLRSACGAFAGGKGIIRTNARRHIAQRWRRRFRKLRRKTRVRRGGDIRHQNVREIPGGPFGETVIVAGPDCPEISGRPADFITVAFRRGNRYMRPAGNAGKAERGFFPPRQWLHRRPKDLRRHRGRNTEQLLYAALRAQAERPSGAASSSAQADRTESHPYRPKARRFAGRDRTEIEAAANMKKSGAGTGQARKRNGKRCRQPPNCAEFIRRSAPDCAFFRSVPHAGAQKLI